MTYLLVASLSCLIGFTCGALLGKAAREEDVRARHPSWRDQP